MPDRMKKEHIMNILTVLELLLGVLFVALDLLIPTLLILAIMVVSMIYRKEKIPAIGFKKPDKPGRLILFVFVLSVIWSLFDFGFVLPILNHITGTHQDVSTFENLKGNWEQLAFLLAAGWILGGFAEETVYRGFLQNRIRDLFAGKRTGIVVGITLTSILFGFAHAEQGVVGIAVTTLDAVFLSLLRLKFQDNLWASVLAHGFINMIGIVTFFFTGPIYGLW
jgi:membrane protease YdiL (CAAX protease family)